MPDPPCLGRLSEIQVPAHVLIGDLDHPDVLGCAETLAATLPQAELTRLPGADHLLPLRVPSLLAEVISAQLTR